jgi:hypothetical protein
MIGWISIAVAKTDRVFRGHPMRPIKLVILVAVWGGIKRPVPLIVSLAKVPPIIASADVTL